MPPIVANSVLPAHRRELSLRTADGLRLYGELATPESGEPVATLVCVHPLTTEGGSMDSHLFRKAGWRLPALAGLAVLRFNMRGAGTGARHSGGEFEAATGLMLTEDEQYDAHQFAQALEEMERGSEGVFATLDKMLAEKQAAAGA